MMDNLLTTKLYIPPPRPNLVPRPRLIQRLEEGLVLGRKLTLISAPAGSGKTTLVTDWICSGARQVAWISMDEGENDPVQFLTYLIAALQQIDHHVGQTVLQILRSPQLPPLQRLVISLINDISAVGAMATLVLDDYQLIHSKSVHEILQFLLEHQPPFMHVVITTREDPPLPMHRLRARGQVTEIRERDLRFTPEEVESFLNRTMGLNLSSEAVTALETRTEGWVAGLQLAALALQEGGDGAQADTFIAAFTGDDRYVMDYLVTEVLERQPPATRDFLHQTAILDRLTAPLCDAVTGRQDSQAILEGLAGANLFLIPLDHRGEWYRYHRLFAEMLRTQLDHKEKMRLHQQTAHWYEANGLLSQAIRHMLACAPASEDSSTGLESASRSASEQGVQALEDAIRLIRLAAEERMLEGRVSTVRHWLDALPDERVRADGKLATYKGWVLALNAEMTSAEEYADVAERCLRQGQEPATDLGKVLVLRSFITLLFHRNYEEAIQLAADALEALEENQPHWRVVALWVMAEARERTRPITEAIAAFREAGRIGHTPGDQVFAVTAEFSLATALNSHGQRQAAVAACEEAIERYTDEMGRTLPMTGLLFSRLGLLHYEANQLELARRYAEKGKVLADQLGLGSPQTLALGVLGPILYAQGETNVALQALQRAHQLSTREALGDASWLLASEVNIRLKEGDLPFAQRWAETAGLSPDHAPQYLRIEEHMVYGHLLLAQGRLSGAGRWLDRLQRFTQERALYRWLITVHVLQALTAARSGGSPSACDYLARALEMAAPQDYYRAFLDEDMQVMALLPAVRHTAPAFVDRLLAYAGVPEPSVRIAKPRRDTLAQPLVEPLSERELEVLGLIAAGFTNAEIAQKLFIAVGTAKRHINHIYGKLDVGSRTQAIAKARDLQLLE
jgi:LuxR family maltose regulon positive regulatory protein